MDDDELTVATDNSISIMSPPIVGTKKSPPPDTIHSPHPPDVNKNMATNFTYTQEECNDSDNVKDGMEDDVNNDVVGTPNDTDSEEEELEGGEIDKGEQGPENEQSLLPMVDCEEQNVSKGGNNEVFDQVNEDHRHFALPAQATKQKKAFVVDKESVAHVHIITKNYLWPKVKFIVNFSELDFSLEPGTICHAFLFSMKKQPHAKEVWWDRRKQLVVQALGQKRNNAMVQIKNTFIGEFVCICCFYSSPYLPLTLQQQKYAPLGRTCLPALLTF